MSPIVDISQLDFAYAGQAVLQGIDLRIDPGETVGLIGPNGGGKTTLLRLMLGLYRPTRGTITIAGMTPRRAIGAGDVIGYLPQHQRVPPRFPISVRQVVRLGLAGRTGMLRGHAAADLEFIESLLDRIGLAELAEAPVTELSGGQRQRVFLARAMAARPRLLLLDEPTTGIDRDGQERFIEFIAELKSQMHLTMVLTSHDPAAIARLSDRVAWLNGTLKCSELRGHGVTAEESVFRMFAGK